MVMKVLRIDIQCLNRDKIRTIWDISWRLSATNTYIQVYI
jgi:hypothetical protein